jgi:hypothetical protein
MVGFCWVCIVKGEFAWIGRFEGVFTRFSIYDNECLLLWVHEQFHLFFSSPRVCLLVLWLARPASSSRENHALVSPSLRTLVPPKHRFSIPSRSVVCVEVLYMSSVAFCAFCS